MRFGGGLDGQPNTPTMPKRIAGPACGGACDRTGPSRPMVRFFVGSQLLFEQPLQTLTGPPHCNWSDAWPRIYPDHNR